MNKNQCSSSEAYSFTTSINDNLKSIAIAKKKLDELDIQKEKEDFNKRLITILENTESEVVKEAIKTIIALPDKDILDYNFKVYCWNNGNFRSEKEISEAYTVKENKKYLHSKEYKEYMNKENPAPIIIGCTYVALMGTYFIAWYNNFFYIFPDTISGALLGIICLNFPIWGTILAATLIPLTIHFGAKDKLNHAQAHGASPYSPEVMNAKKTAVASLAVGAVAAGFAAKAINDKVKKESQIKKDF